MTAIAGKTDSHENSLLLLLFNNTGYAKIGDAAGILPSAVAGSLYASLHTADPARRTGMGEADSPKGARHP